MKLIVLFVMLVLSVPCYAGFNIVTHKQMQELIKGTTFYNDTMYYNARPNLKREVNKDNVQPKKSVFKRIINWITNLFSWL